MTRVSIRADGFPGTREGMRDALSPSIRAEKQRSRLVIAICGTSVAAEAIGTKTNAWLIISGINPLAQPIEASLAKPDLNAPASVSISASVIGVENTHAPVLMMLQPSLWR